MAERTRVPFRVVPLVGETVEEDEPQTQEGWDEPIPIEFEIPGPEPAPSPPVPEPMPVSPVPLAPDAGAAAPAPADPTRLRPGEVASIWFPWFKWRAALTSSTLDEIGEGGFEALKYLIILYLPYCVLLLAFANTMLRNKSVTQRAVMAFVLFSFLGLPATAFSPLPLVRWLAFQLAAFQPSLPASGPGK